MWTCSLSLRVCKGVLRHNNIKAFRYPKNAIKLYSSIATNQCNTLPSPITQNDVDLEDYGSDDSEEIWSAAPGYRPTFNFAAYANDSELIQKFVHLGVELYKWEKHIKVPEKIMKLNFEKDVGPRIRFLVDNGLSPDRLAAFFTKNPFIFEQELENLHKRVDYLKSKKFTSENIAQIIDECPTWLNLSIEDIDRRLGFFQKTFHLDGNSVRRLATIGPLTVMAYPEQIKNINLKVKDEMGFEPDEIRELLLTCPRIWIVSPWKLWRRFDQLHNDFKFTHEELVRSPQILLQPEGRIRERVNFLRSIGRAQFNPEKPNFISTDMLINTEDSEFAVQVAKTSIQVYNKFLKTL